jgi:hypothetical protein
MFEAAKQQLLTVRHFDPCSNIEQHTILDVEDGGMGVSNRSLAGDIGIPLTMVIVC